MYTEGKNSQFTICEEEEEEHQIIDNRFSVQDINQVYQEYEMPVIVNEFVVNDKELTTKGIMSYINGFSRDDDPTIESYAIEKNISELENLINNEEKSKVIKYYSLSEDDIYKINYDINLFKKDIKNEDINFDDTNFKKEYSLLKYDYHKNTFLDNFNVYEKKAMIWKCLYFDNIRHMDIDQEVSSSDIALLKTKSKSYEMKKYIKEKNELACIFKYKSNGIDYSICQWFCSNPYGKRNYDYSFKDMYLLIQVCKK